MKRRRRAFWPLLFLATVCSSLAAASFATAVFSDPPAPIVLPRRVIDDISTSKAELHSYWDRSVLGRVESLRWSSDRPFLIAAIALCAAAAVAAALAARLR